MCAKVFSVLGESQFGKSSFINMISGGNSQSVGTGNGKSCTSQVSAVTFRDILGIFQVNAEICCMDVPGFNDTSLAISNKQTLDSIKFTLAEKKLPRLDALFVFQSASESAIRLNKLFSTAESLFGATVVRSCVIIATKSDLVAKRILPMRRETIESFAREKNIPVVWWVNDSDEPVAADIKQEQVASLRTALAGVQPYNIADIRQFEQRIKVKAEQLMNADSTNKVQNTVKVPYDVAVPYEVNEFCIVPVIRLKYTEEQVLNHARYLQSLQQNKEPYNVMERVVEKVKKYETYTDWERVVSRSWFLFFNWENAKYVRVQKVREIYVDEEKWVNKVHYRDKPLESFTALRRETVVVNEQQVRRVQRWTTERRFRTERVTSLRRDWTCYRAQAVKELISQLSST